MTDAALQAIVEAAQLGVLWSADVSRVQARIEEITNELSVAEDRIASYVNLGAQQGGHANLVEEATADHSERMRELP